MPVPPDVLEYVTQHPILYQYASVDTAVNGFVVLPMGAAQPVVAAMIAASPIRSSDNAEPIGGSLILIRLLDTAEVARLGDRTQLSID